MRWSPGHGASSSTRDACRRGGGACSARLPARKQAVPWWSAASTVGSASASTASRIAQAPGEVAAEGGDPGPARGDRGAEGMRRDRRPPAAPVPGRRPTAPRPPRPGPGRAAPPRRRTGRTRRSTPAGAGIVHPRRSPTAPGSHAEAHAVTAAASADHLRVIDRIGVGERGSPVAASGSGRAAASCPAHRCGVTHRAPTYAVELPPPGRPGPLELGLPVGSPRSDLGASPPSAVDRTNASPRSTGTTSLTSTSAAISTSAAKPSRPARARSRTRGSSSASRPATCPVRRLGHPRLGTQADRRPGPARAGQHRAGTPQVLDRRAQRAVGPPLPGGDDRDRRRRPPRPPASARPPPRCAGRRRRPSRPESASAKADRRPVRRGQHQPLDPPTRRTGSPARG